MNTPQPLPRLPSPDTHSSHHRHFVEDPCSTKTTKAPSWNWQWRRRHERRRANRCASK